MFSVAKRRCGASGSARRRLTRASGRARPRSPIDFGRHEHTTAEVQTTTRGLRPLIDRSPALQETRPLANILSAIADAGLEAMSYLSSGDAPPTEWRNTQLPKLDEAAKPRAALEFVVIK